MELGIHGIVVSLGNLVLLLERYEADFLPSRSEILSCLLYACALLRNVSIDFFDQCLLGLEVGSVIVFWRSMLVPFCEELITSCAETLPHLLGLFLGTAPISFH